MAYIPSPSQTEPEKKQTASPAPDTRTNLDHLRSGVSENKPLALQISELLASFNTLSPDERKRLLGSVAAAATPLLLNYLMTEEKKSPEEPAKKKRRKRKKNPDEKASAGVQTAGTINAETAEEPTPREKRRKVVCDNMRLICINTDPVANMVPKRFYNNSSLLLEYGLPEFDTFVEEMIDALAPDETDREKALKRVWRILKASPMGKYQCMPQYLFGNVADFKKYNIADWKAEGQEEDKLRAVWEFLQNENYQKEAARAYLSSSARQYGRDAEVVAASFYGGSRAAQALQAYKAGTATPEQIELVEKQQAGGYRSIASYAGTSRGTGSFNVDAELSRTASRESGNLEGKKSKPRDAAWESDQRYSYNRQPERGNNRTA